MGSEMCIRDRLRWIWGRPRLGSWEGGGPGGWPMSTTPVSAMSALRAASRLASRVVSSGARSEGGIEGVGVGGGGAFWELLGLQRPVMVAAVVGYSAVSGSHVCGQRLLYGDFEMSMHLLRYWLRKYTAQRPARIESSGSLAYRAFSPQSWSVAIVPRLIRLAYSIYLESSCSLILASYTKK